MKFKVKQHVRDYVEVEGEFKAVDAVVDYSVENYDDLQNLLMTLIDFSESEVKFTIRKKEDE